MAQRYPGFYLYFDWIDVLSTLPSAKAMEIICNMKAYLAEGIEPPPMKGNAGSIQHLILAQLKRSRINSANGRHGGTPSHKASREKTFDTTGIILNDGIDTTAPYLTESIRHELSAILEDRRDGQA